MNSLPMQQCEGVSRDAHTATAPAGEESRFFGMQRPAISSIPTVSIWDDTGRSPRTFAM